MPGEADVLAHNGFVIIADVPAERQGRPRIRSEIGAIASRDSESPNFVGTKSEPAADGRIVEAPFCHVPLFRSRRERSVLHLRRVIELAEPAGHGNTTRVAWSPNDRVVFVFLGRF